MLTDNAVPKDAFKGAKGVVFLQAAAAAVGLTAFRGQGFIVARVDGSWSAPAFIRLATMGMGLSLGGVLALCIIAQVPKLDSDVSTHVQHLGCPRMLCLIACLSLSKGPLRTASTRQIMAPFRRKGAAGQMALQSHCRRFVKLMKTVIA